MQRASQLAIALVAGALVAGLAFALASADAEPEALEETYGQAHSFHFEEGEQVNESLTFSGDPTLPAPPDELDLRVYVFLETTSPDPHAEGTDLDVVTYANGQQADVVHFRGGTAGVAMLQPERLENEAALREGHNEIEVQVDVHRSAEAKGANNVTIGPLTVEATPLEEGATANATSGSLGGMPPAVTSSAAGLLTGAAAWWIAGRWRDDEEGPP